MFELTKDNFEAEVTNYTEKPVFVDFWGDKCDNLYRNDARCS